MLLFLAVVCLGLRQVTKQTLWDRTDTTLIQTVGKVAITYQTILRDPAHAAERKLAAERVLTNIDRQLRSLPGSGRTGKGYWPIRVLDLRGKAFLREYARTQGVDWPWDKKLFDQAIKGKKTIVDFHDEDQAPVRLYSTPLVVRGTTVGVIQGVESLKEANSILSELDVALQRGAIIVVFACAVCAWVLAGVAVRPVKRLSEQILDGGQTPIPLEGNELDLIATSFNSASARLLQYAEGVEAAATRQREFLQDASHELRSPLTVISANLSLVIETSRLSGKDREALESALSSAGAMKRLVEDLLLIARSGEAPKTVGQPVDLTSVLKRLASEDTALPAIDVDVMEDLVVHGDPESLSRIFRNLIENVRVHAPGAHATLRACMESDSVIVTVQDDGPGVAPEDLSRLCDRFFRAGLKRPGSGLGLTICQKLVEDLGGTLQFSSELGRGLAAEVRLAAVSQPITITQEPLHKP